MSDTPYVNTHAVAIQILASYVYNRMQSDAFFHPTLR